MTANLLFFALYVVLSRLSRTILCVEMEERLESRRQLPEEMDNIPSQKVTKEHFMSCGTKGDTTHMQLLLDHPERWASREDFQIRERCARNFNALGYSRFNAGNERN